MEHAFLKGARTGIRTALCTLAVDAPQLRVLIDAGALVSVGGRHAAAGEGVADWEDVCEEVEGVEMLKRHRLLKQCVHSFVRSTVV